MILYFSGTGNSKFAAQAIASVTGDSIVSINELIKSGSKEKHQSENPYVFVCPTYAWRIPRVVEKYIKETRFEESKKAYFILTCGSETHNAVHYIKKLCEEKGLLFMGIATVVMPENYIAMYDAPNQEQADVINKKATPQILALAEYISKQKSLPEEKVTPAGRLISRIINPIFYLTIVSAKGFHSTNACISCEKCVKLCPLNNIRMEEGKPQWGQNCTHCMACICGCPSEAIEYKNKSQGKARYYNKGYNN